MNERIKELRIFLGLSQESFGSKIGLTKSGISKMESGMNPSNQTIISICHEFNVSEEWLRCGTGEMFIHLSADEEVYECVQDLLSDEDDVVGSVIKNFIVVYEKLDESSKKILNDVAAELLARTTKSRT